MINQVLKSGFPTVLGSRTRRAKGRNRGYQRHMSGGKAYSEALTPNTGIIQPKSAPPVASPTIVRGAESVFNVNGSFNKGAIVLQLTNSSNTDPADVVISGDKFLGTAADGNYRQQVVEGSQTIANDAGTDCAVVLATSFGVNSAINWNVLRKVILEQGLAISGMRMRVTTEQQFSQVLQFQKFDWQGDHTIDKVLPDNYRNEKNFDNKVIGIDHGFVLDSQMLFKVRLQPAEVLTLTLFAYATNVPSEALTSYVRKQSPSSLM